MVQLAIAVRLWTVTIDQGDWDSVFSLVGLLEDPNDEWTLK